MILLISQMSQRKCQLLFETKICFLEIVVLKLETNFIFYLFELYKAKPGHCETCHIKIQSYEFN